MFSVRGSLKYLAFVIALGVGTAHATGAEKLQACRSQVEALANSSERSFFERQALTNLVRRNNRVGILAHCATAVGTSITRK